MIECVTINHFYHMTFFKIKIISKKMIDLDTSRKHMGWNEHNLVTNSYT
jgi:hypothetical protein